MHALAGIVEWLHLSAVSVGLRLPSRCGNMCYGSLLIVVTLHLLHRLRSRHPSVLSSVVVLMLHVDSMDMEICADLCERPHFGLITVFWRLPRPRRK